MKSNWKEHDITDMVNIVCNRKKRKKTVVYLGNKLAITAFALVLQHSPSLQESSLQIGNIVRNYVRKQRHCFCFITAD